MLGSGESITCRESQIDSPFTILIHGARRTYYLRWSVRVHTVYIDIAVVTPFLGYAALDHCTENR
jgi:hypothetical protein